MLEGGAFGDDLSANFSFDQINSNGATEANLLTIRETTPCLTHRTWVAVRCTGACWPGVLEFCAGYKVLMGDVDNNGRVLSGDASSIYPLVSPALVNDDVREDVDGSGRVLSGDASSVYPNISPAPLPKPSGHTCGFSLLFSEGSSGGVGSAPGLGGVDDSQRPPTTGTFR